MCVIKFSLGIHDMFEFLNGAAVTLDEGDRDVKSINVNSNTLYGARRISRFGESIADFPAKLFIFRKVDMFGPSDVVGVEKER